MGLRRLAVGWWGCLALVAGAAAGEQCQIIMPRPGHAFYAGEPVQLSLAVSGPRQRLTYSVTDDRGLILRTGEVSVGLGRTVELGFAGSLPTGWFTLRLAGRGVQAEEAFCVIPRPWDAPGDYRLFGLHPDDWSPESLQAAAQIGVRHIRHGIFWPNAEPNRGQWDQAYIERGYQWAQRSGQQMLVLLGHTPYFLAQRAENCHSWIEQAWFTWQPREPDEFAAYVRKVTDFAGDKRVLWPPAEIMPRGEMVPQESVPWVWGWEMWNEVDLIYYFGDWNRYCELLHLAYGTSRQRTPEAPLLYGGSTGNWPAMCRLMSGPGQYTYDYNTFHPDHEITRRLSLWYSGAPQVPYCVGVPRETIHTEAYATAVEQGENLPAYRETPGELLRLYLTLKAWREVGYYRSGCLGAWIDNGQLPCRGMSLLVRTEEGLRPTPLYPAFAAARWLVSNATLVGPVKLEADVTAYAFLKDGRVMLAAWTDGVAEVTLELEPGAYRVDAMGRQFHLRDRPRCRYRLTHEPLVVVGAKPSAYLGSALRQEYGLFAGTYYGVPPWPQCGVWYTGKLEQDVADCAGPDAPDRLLTAVRRAARALARDQGPAEVLAAQGACGEVMARVARRCQATGETDHQAANTVWRLARVSEWLGEVADAAADPGTRSVGPAACAEVWRQLQQVQTAVRGSGGQATRPFADKLVDRARRGLTASEQATGAGQLAAARQKIDLARQWGAVEPPVELSVVPLVDFLSARLMRKAVLLEPGRRHTLRLWVQNLRPEAVHGSLTVGFPELWEPRQATVAFRAPADGPSKSVDIPFEVPGVPLPWVRRTSFTLDCDLMVELPAALRDESEVRVEGEVRDGAAMAAVRYFVHVGRPADGGP